VTPEGSEANWGQTNNVPESHVCDHRVAMHRAHKRADIRRNDKNQRGYAHIDLGLTPAEPNVAA